MITVCLICLAVMGTILVCTLALMFLPVREWEVALWHRARIQHVRRWLTRRRHVDQPLHRDTTLTTARSLVRWHLFFTVLFTAMIARAATTGLWWLQFPAALLVIPALAYLLGSMVQRQKIALLVLRHASSSPPHH